MSSPPGTPFAWSVGRLSAVVAEPPGEMLHHERVHAQIDRLAVGQPNIDLVGRRIDLPERIDLDDVEL
jgi:hypothetical protein